MGIVLADDGWVGGGLSYGYNQNGSVAGNGALGLENTTSMNGPGYPPPIRESQIVMPSDMIAIGDATFQPDSLRVLDTPGAMPPVYGLPWLDAFASREKWYSEVMSNQPAGDAAVRAMNQRHGGKWNMGFCDGHVENLKAKQLFDLRNLSAMQRWNNDHQPHYGEGWTGYVGMPGFQP